MKHNALAVLALAVVLSAVVAAMTTALLVSADGRAPGQDSSALSATPEIDFDARLLAEIEVLRRESDDLRVRLAVLESRPVPGLRTAAGAVPTLEDFETLQEEVRKATASRGGSLPPPAELKTQVAEALTSIRKDEAVGAVQKRADQIEERLSGLREWLALDSYQANAMRTVLANRDMRDQELIRMWEANADQEFMGEVKRTNAVDFQNEIARVLSPAQLATFQEKFGPGPAAPGAPAGPGKN